MKIDEHEVSVVIICVAVVSVISFFSYFLLSGTHLMSELFFITETALQIVIHQSGNWGKAWTVLYLDWFTLALLFLLVWLIFVWNFLTQFYNFTDLTNVFTSVVSYRSKHILCIVIWNNINWEFILKTDGFFIIFLSSHSMTEARLALVWFKGVKSVLKLSLSRICSWKKVLRFLPSAIIIR